MLGIVAPTKFAACKLFPSKGITRSLRIFIQSYMVKKFFDQM